MPELPPDLQLRVEALATLPADERGVAVDQLCREHTGLAGAIRAHARWVDGIRRLGSLSEADLTLVLRIIDLADASERASAAADLCRERPELGGVVDAAARLAERGPENLAADLASSLAESVRTRLASAAARLHGGRTTSPGSESFGPYRVLEEIGAGGMGVVYLAEQRQPIRRRVALKVIKLGMDTRAVLARFEVERAALALMEHQNIAKVLDVGATPEGKPFFVMEYVRGLPIVRYCDQNRLAVDERLRLLLQVCSGVQHAHTKGVIHRDLTPNNILVTVQDGVANAKIIDFGLARATDHRLTEKTLFTERGVILGTPEYMSPEQAGLDNLDIDTRSDVYTLGVLLYELLTGSLPIDARTLRQAGYDGICRAIREGQVPRPSTRISTASGGPAAVANRRRTEARELARRLRGDLDWVVMKCLEKDRTRRYGTVAELAADIQRHLEGEPVLARAPTVGYRLQKLMVKHRGPLIAAAVVALALVLGLTGTTWFLLEARAQARIATSMVEQRGRALELAEARTAEAVAERNAAQRERDEKAELFAQLAAAVVSRDETIGKLDKALRKVRNSQNSMTWVGTVRSSPAGPNSPADLGARAAAIRETAGPAAAADWLQESEAWLAVEQARLDLACGLADSTLRRLAPIRALPTASLPPSLAADLAWLEARAEERLGRRPPTTAHWRNPPPAPDRRSPARLVQAARRLDWDAKPVAAMQAWLRACDAATQEGGIDADLLAATARALLDATALCDDRDEQLLVDAAGGLQRSIVAAGAADNADAERLYGSLLVALAAEEHARDAWASQVLARERDAARLRHADLRSELARADASEVRAAWRKLKAFLGSQNGRPLRPRPTAVPALVDLLPVDAALLEFVAADSAVLVFVVTRSGVEREAMQISRPWSGTDPSAAERCLGRTLQRWPRLREAKTLWIAAHPEAAPLAFERARVGGVGPPFAAGRDVWRIPSGNHLWRQLARRRGTPSPPAAGGTTTARERAIVALAAPGTWVAPAAVVLHPIHPLCSYVELSAAADSWDERLTLAEMHGLTPDCNTLVFAAVAPADSAMRVHWVRGCLSGSATGVLLASARTRDPTAAPPGVTDVLAGRRAAGLDAEVWRYELWGTK